MFQLFEVEGNPSTLYLCGVELYMKIVSRIFCGIYFFTVAFLTACTSPEITDPSPLPSLKATETSQLYSSIQGTETETPMISRTATLNPITSTPDAATTAVPVPKPTITFGVDNMLILYTTVQQISPDIISIPSAEATRGSLEEIQESTMSSNASIDYWSLRAWPDNSLFEQPVFSVFYGETAKSSDIDLYFLNFRPQLSPNGRYLLLPGIGGYKRPDNDPGTGLWLADLHMENVRKLLPQAKIATWNPQSNQITYVENDTVYTLSIDEGATPIPLFSHADLNWLYARWSPDGHWIAVLTTKAGGVTGQSADTLWIVPTNGEPAIKLVSGEGSAREHVANEITWSNDSQFLLFRNEVFNLSGENLSPEFSGKTDWLPNQSLLLVNGDSGLQITTVDGKVIAEFGNTFSSAWAFSNDNQKLAYVQALPNGQGNNIFTFEIGTQKIELIATLPTNHLNLIRWSIDDEYLIIDDGQNETPIWKIDTQPNSTRTEMSANGILVEVIPLP